MKISVVMGTYNGEQYLEQQLESIDRQDRRPDEVIIVDDRSSDRSVSIIENFKKESKIPICFFQNESNLGFSANFSKGLSLSTGDLIFLCDQDDFWFPEKITIIEALALKNPRTQLFMNDAVITDASLNPFDVSRLEQTYNLGGTKNDYILGCCCAVRRGFLDACLPIPSRFAHDSWLINLANLLGLSLVSERKLQFYRRHSSNESQHIGHSGKRLNSFFLFLHRLGKLQKLRSLELLEEKIYRSETFLIGLRLLDERLDLELGGLGIAQRSCRRELDILRQSYSLRAYGHVQRLERIFLLFLQRKFKFKARHFLTDLIGEPIVK